MAIKQLKRGKPVTDRTKDNANVVAFAEATFGQGDFNRHLARSNYLARHHGRIIVPGDKSTPHCDVAKQEQS